MAVIVQIITADIHNHRQGHIPRHQVEVLRQVEVAVVAVSADLAETNQDGSFKEET